VTEIVTFVPQAHLEAAANMAAFIELCKTKLTVFGQSLDFESDVWDVSESIELSGKTSAVRLVYANQETCETAVLVMMREPFRSFAKSYMRYQGGMNPTKDLGKRMSSLRALEVALWETGTADPVRIDSHVLNRAAQLIGSWVSPSTAYRTGLQLQMIADLVADNRLVEVPTKWRNPLKRPTDTTRVGKEADERREAKMPSQAVLDALPKVFRFATEPADILVSSTTAILCSAPDRISEVLGLPVNCEVRQKRERSEEEAYGLRWWPAKGAEPMVKWIVPSMAGVVEEALRKIRALTDEARDVARWYEANPTRLYLTENTEHFRSQEWLRYEEVAEIIFADSVDASAAVDWRKRNEVPRETRGRTDYMRFADVEAAVLRMLPKGFPLVDKKTELTYSEALFVVQRNALHATRARYRCVIERATQTDIHSRLGARSTTGILSIFDRCECFEPDGSTIHVTSHQFRHYLNTLAQTGGMSQLDIAKWSGRKDVSQNKYYDHEPTGAIVARIRSSIGDDTRMFGPLATGPRAALISRDEFARLKIPTAHTTDYGYCIHDYVMSPCQMHRDCLNCGEQVCVKGQQEKEKRIRQAHAEATHLLAMAEQAVANGEFGAEEWVEHHRVQLDRLADLIEILDDPVVLPGAIIQLMPAGIPSRLDHSAQARALLPTPEGTPIAPVLVEEPLWLE
jgi:hypothetical protein